MKLFMLFVIKSAIAGSVGPLPYDLDTCLANAEQMRQDFVAAEAEKGLPPSADGEKIAADDIKIVCAELEAKPELGSPWK